MTERESETPDELMRDAGIPVDLINAVRRSFEGALKVGAPGLHEPTRNAVMLSAMVRFRHEFAALSQPSGSGVLSENEIGQIIMVEQNCGYGDVKDGQHCRMYCDDESLHPKMERFDKCDCKQIAKAIVARLSASPSEGQGANDERAD